jgi:hypothetical protein
MQNRLNSRWQARLSFGPKRSVVLLSGLFVVSCGQAFAQIPLPGNQTSPDSNQYANYAGNANVNQAAPTAPTPGAAPVPGQWQAAAGKAQSAYQQLPITQSEAEMRVQDLKAQMATASPAVMQESLFQLGEWLADMADAHSKMATSFSKREAMKAEAQTERSSAQKLNQLKNQIQLLKAELLIRLHRYPEALQPLVDIVVAEPNSATGQAAYQHLRELGFSQYAPVTSVQPVVPQPSAKNEEKPKIGGQAFPTTELTDTTTEPTIDKIMTAPKYLPAQRKSLPATVHAQVHPATAHGQVHPATTKVIGKIRTKTIVGDSGAVTKSAEKPQGQEKVWISGTPTGR